ncbi:MAG TPA: hypothetical protein VMF06_10935 [Candidatus Limnocylindria bacterium]|nr:hypothetical protein [Candidatus Limnocylindria bacterium]
MKKLFCLLGLVALIEGSMAKAGAADILTLDPEGYVRDWVMLAPIALPSSDTASDLLLREQIKTEATVKPKAGDRVTVNGKELVWRNVTAPTNFFDFNAVLKTQNDHAAGFIVTYVECDQDIPDVTMAVASNDEGRIYFNGVDIYAFTEARPLLLDADKGRVTLKKGVNVIVFKILNEQNSWQGAMRLLDKAGTPLKNVKIRLSP